MKYLESRADIAHGELIIKGTRIRIAQVMRMLVGGMTLEQIHNEWWPWITSKKIRGAVEEAINFFEKTNNDKKILQT